jgi:hypothetical protein
MKTKSIYNLLDSSQDAQSVVSDSGVEVEASDRWTQSAVLVRLARQCFGRALALINSDSG